MKGVLLFSVILEDLNIKTPAETAVVCISPKTLLMMHKVPFAEQELGTTLLL